MSTFHRSIQWQRKAIRQALDTMPNRGSQEFPVYGHSEQLLDRSTMIEQILDVEAIARHNASKLIGRWAKTGRWPRVSGCAAFFIEAALREAQDRCRGVSESQQPEDFSVPPWTKDDVAWLSGLVLSGWEFGEWLERWATREFQSQERAFRSYHL
jgi:hypothetical protein